MSQFISFDKGAINRNIAILLTCHNRVAKTVRCMDSLVRSVDYYNNKYGTGLYCEVYLTDDGCTDDTVAQVENILRGHLRLNIIKGDGSLYWAGGMRAAWKEALKKTWDFYWLLNDDCVLYETCLLVLLDTHSYCVRTYGKEGIYSGITCDSQNHNVITYGGRRWVNRFFGTAKLVGTAETPQMCDMANANILLVPASVVDKNGVFYEAYLHGSADFDYSIHVRKLGLPVLTTSCVCGTCDFDHESADELLEKFVGMSLKKRIDYFISPLHSCRNNYIYLKRNVPSRLPFAIIGNILTILCPNLYRWAFYVKKNVLKS